ncbi:unnamed protein product [Penicillium glandicola]
MKILALHGLGSSTWMLQQQLAPFVRELGTSCEFTFLDGAIACGRGPGVPDWVSGPFYSYTTGFSPLEMREALDRLEDFIQERGPFDGVFGFSLGAALAISYILDHQRKDALAPFSFAVFFSPIFVTLPDESYCQGLLQRWVDDDHMQFRSEFPDGEFMSPLKDSTERTLAEYLKVVQLMQSMWVGIIPPKTTIDFLGGDGVAEIPRLVHPDLLRGRIKIPTVHITGRKDSPCIGQQSRIAQKLCLASIMRVHEHDGGHDVPYKKSDINNIVSSIREMAKEGEYIRDIYEL